MKIALLDFYTHGHHLKYAGELADYLHQKGDEVMFFTLEKDEKVDQFLKNHPFVILNVIYTQGNNRKKNQSFLARRYLDIKETCKIFSEAEKWHADVLHFLYFDSFYTIYLLSFRKWKFKFFGSSLWLLSNIGNFEDGGVYSKVIKKINQIILKKLLKKDSICKIFVQNIYPEGFKKEALRQVKWLEDFKDKFLFLNDPIYDAPFGAYTKDQAVEKLNLPKDVPIFLFFGLLGGGKRLDVLFDSLFKIKDKICLVIAGAPDVFTQKDVDEFKNRINGKHIIIDRIGFVPENDVPYYFVGADCVVLPYSAGYKLGSSGVLMQACSARKPVICSDIGIFGKVVTENFLGLSVKADSVESLAEGIETFLNQRKELTEKVRLSAQNYIESASWAKVAGLIYKSYLSEC